MRRSPTSKKTRTSRARREGVARSRSGANEARGRGCSTEKSTSLRGILRTIVHNRAKRVLDFVASGVLKMDVSGQ